ncbi:MAG: bifunctional oligoribonuclease/PAP phosphatase NrnA [Desulfuromonadales bacterium]|nr:bifunctional oligoribonuclease/PAP phosphatase NrnA [Desulfuromonadales bacterium]
MIEQILQLITSSQTILVASHENPDGDAIGSTLALTNALREMGKHVVAYNRDQAPHEYMFLPGCDTLVNELDESQTFDAGFVLDAGDLNRAGNWIRERCQTLVNMDHHPYSKDFGDIYYVDTEASATGVLIYRLLSAAGHEVSAEVATCIYTAILSDTGSFRYSNANPEAFHVAGEMVGLGVDPWSIASGLYESQEEVRLRLLALALPTLRVSDCGRYASIAVTLDMYDASGAVESDTDRFINYPRSIRGVEVAIFFRQLSENKFKIGFRSKGNIDVGALARAMDGGGHHNAAGAEVEGTLESVQGWVYDRVAKLIDEHR